MPRKKKPVLKHHCPCCGEYLTKKTIDRHLTGKHLPTRIQVTLSKQNRDSSVGNFSSSNLSSSDVSNLDSDNGEVDMDDGEINSNTSDLEFNKDVNFEHDNFEYDAVNMEENFETQHTIAEVISNTWSGRRAEVHEHESDTDESESD